MAALALPVWARTQHPIVRYETRHWLRSRVWRGARVALWGGSLTFLLVPIGCSLLFGLTASFASVPEGILTIGGTLTVGLAVVSTLSNWLNALTASLLGATLIARERECQTWPFLRLTSLTSIEIVGGKFAALLYILARPLQLVFALRILALVSGTLTVLLTLIASRLPLNQILALLGNLPMSPEELAAARILGLVGVPIGLLGWLIEPFFSVIYNGVVGLAASTLARSRGSGVVIMVAAQFVLNLGVYAPAQQVATLLLLGTLQPATIFGGAPGGIGPLVAIIPAAAIALQFGLQTGLRLAVLLVGLGFTLRRVEKLSD